MLALLATALAGPVAERRRGAERVTLARLSEPPPPAPPAPLPPAARDDRPRTAPPLVPPRPPAAVADAGARAALPGAGAAMASAGAAPAPPPPSPAAAAGPPPAASPAAPDEDAAWRAYQALLWQRILARRPAGMALAGRTGLRFTLDSGGRLLAADVAAPSGNALLDRLALRTLRDAAPFPPVPPALADRALVFTVTFSFR